MSGFTVNKSILSSVFFILLASHAYAGQPEEYACPLPGKPQIREKDAIASMGGRFDSIRNGGYKHGALDLNSTPGTPVLAVREGVAAVAREDWDVMGNTVVIDHGDGEYSVYGHLDSISIKEGERISRGSVIGSVGYTGNAERLKERKLPAHLHFAIVRAGEPGLADKGREAREGKRWEEFWLSLSANVKDAVDPSIVMGEERCWSGAR